MGRPGPLETRNVRWKGGLPTRVTTGTLRLRRLRGREGEQRQTDSEALQDTAALRVTMAAGETKRSGETIGQAAGLGEGLGGRRRPRELQQAKLARCGSLGLGGPSQSHSTLDPSRDL